jgi:hypothetical protein
MKDNFVYDMYAAVDSMKAENLMVFLADNGIFKFANAPAVEGKDNIKLFLDGFYKSIKGIRHDQIEDWQVNGTRFAIGRVTYTRHDDSILQVPFSVVLKMKDEKVKDYLIYVDASELYSSN